MMERATIYDRYRRAYAALLAAAMIAALVALHHAQCRTAKVSVAAKATMQWSADSTWTKGDWE